MVTVQTSKETAKIEALVEAATANIIFTWTGDKTETKGTGIKKETQAAIREATRSETIMILEPRVRK